MKTLTFDSYPILLVSDVHADITKIKKIKRKHPEIQNRVFLGDLFDFLCPENNYATGEWLKTEINDWIWIAGNHCVETIRGEHNIDRSHKYLFNNNFHICVRLNVGQDSYLLCHSKPRDLWRFINAGYTERELLEDFPDLTGIKYILSGHTHKETIHTFLDSDCQIIQIGAAKDKKYGILTEKGVEFKRL